MVPTAFGLKELRLKLLLARNRPERGAVQSFQVAVTQVSGIRRFVCGWNAQVRFELEMRQRAAVHKITLRCDETALLPYLCWGFKLNFVYVGQTVTCLHKVVVSIFSQLDWTGNIPQSGLPCSVLAWTFSNSATKSKPIERNWKKVRRVVDLLCAFDVRNLICQNPSSGRQSPVVVVRYVVLVRSIGDENRLLIKDPRIWIILDLRENPCFVWFLWSENFQSVSLGHENVRFSSFWNFCFLFGGRSRWGRDFTRSSRTGSNTRCFQSSPSSWLRKVLPGRVLRSMNINVNNPVAVAVDR